MNGALEVSFTPARLNIKAQKEALNVDDHEDDDHDDHGDNGDDEDDGDGLVCVCACVV